jgi:hypothetical protein
LKGERVRERALQSRTLTDRRSITLPLCVLAAGAVHGLAVMAMLPVLITLPGPGSVRQSATQVVEVEVLPAVSPEPRPVVDHGPETTAALPTVEHEPGPETPPEGGADNTEPVPAEPGAAATDIRSDPLTTVRVPDAEPIPAAPAATPGQAEVEPAEETSPQTGGEPSPVETEEATTEKETAGETAKDLEPEPKAPEETVAPEETEAVPEAPDAAEALQTKAPEKAASGPEAKAPSKTKPAARAPVAEKKPGTTATKRGTTRARRTVRTRTVTTVPQGGILQDLFGGPQRAAPSSGGGTPGRSTIQR